MMCDALCCESVSVLALCFGREAQLCSPALQGLACLVRSPLPCSKESARSNPIEGRRMKTSTFGAFCLLFSCPVWSVSSISAVLEGCSWCCVSLGRSQEPCAALGVLSLSGHSAV